MVKEEETKYKPKFISLDDYIKFEIHGDEYPNYRKAFIWEDEESSFYRTYSDNTLLINVTGFCWKSTEKTMLKALDSNETQTFSAKNKFFMLRGKSVGEMIAKNYWKYFIEDRDKKLNSVPRERKTQYKRAFTVNKLHHEVILGGRIDILDENLGVIIEVKTTTNGKDKVLEGQKHTFSAINPMKQAVLYKMSLEQENPEKYAGYKIVVVIYFEKWKEEGLNDAFWVIEINEKQFQEIKDDILDMMDVVEKWWVENREKYQQQSYYKSVEV
ncbi:MAG: hypothetical protein E3J43_00220 [Candidatus Heimdallarchaeota archaeon]|nr:MAG: hypothetical protein E3J43_00220 [Candidatus Heimdallarchaeota archaeon]